MKPGKGNDPVSDYSPPSLLDPPARKRGLSINGEVVPERDLDCINIHDFAVFEKEQDLIPEFRVTIKSRSSASSEGPSPTAAWPGGHGEGEGEGEGGGGSGFLVAGEGAPVARTPSFKRIAQRVRMVERVLLRWPCRPRTRHHSSSSEDFNQDDDLETNNNNNNNNNQAGAGKASTAQPDALSLDTSVSRLSTQDVHIASLEGDAEEETNSCSAAHPQAVEAKNTSDGADPSADKDVFFDQNSSNNAQSVRDINLNEDKNAVARTSEPTSSPEALAGKARRDDGDAPVSPSDPPQQVQEGSKVVSKSPVSPPPPSGPECCDRGGVVHDVSPTSPPAAALKAPAPKEGRSQREARWCPCALL